MWPPVPLITYPQTFLLFPVNRLSVTSFEQVKYFANCPDEGADDDGYKHNFFTVPQTLHLSFQKSWYILRRFFFRVLFSMHALIVIIIIIIFIITINIISSNTL